MNEELKLIISAEISKFKQGVADAKKQMEDFTRDSEKGASKMDEAFKKIGSAAQTGLKVAAGAIVGVTAALVALGPATEEYRRNQALLASAFETAGGSADMAKNTYNDLYRVLGDTGQATEAAQQLAKLTTEEKALTEYTDILQGVYATFGESLPLESLSEAMNHTAKLGEVQGSLADALEWSGVNVEDFNAKLAECNSESEREKLIRETLNGLYSEASAAYEKNAADILANNEAQARLDAAMAATGEAMMPVMTMLKELGADVLTAIQPYITSFAENYLPVIRDVLGEVGTKLSETLNWIKEHQTLLTVIAGVIGGLVTAIGLYNVVAAVKAAMDAAQVTTLGALAAAYLAQAAAMLVAIAPYALIVAAIAAVIAIIVVCVKHWDEIKAKVKEVWDNIKQKTQETVENVKQKFEDMKQKLGEKVENIKRSITEKFEAMKAAIQEKINAAKEVVTTIFEAIKNNIQQKIEFAKTIIQNVLAAIKGIFTGDLGAVKTAVSNIFGAIKDNITSKINAARDGVKTAIDKIKGFFNFKWELPKIKLPHFSITGKFSLDPPSIPKFSVSWYQKGGIFDSPTLFGYGNGQVGGLGENGAEAIVPLEKNTEWLDKIAERLGAGSNRPIVLQVDGKTFAETSFNTMNDYIKQTGTMPLRIMV